MIRKIMFYIRGHERPISVTDTETSESLEELVRNINLSMQGDGIATFRNENKKVKDIIISRNYCIDTIHVSERPDNFNKKFSMKKEEEETEIDLHGIIEETDIGEEKEIIVSDVNDDLDVKKVIEEGDEIIIEDQTKNIEEEKLNEETDEEEEK